MPVRNSFQSTPVPHGDARSIKYVPPNNTTAHLGADADYMPAQPKGGLSSLDALKTAFTTALQLLLDPFDNIWRNFFDLIDGHLKFMRSAIPGINQVYP